MTTLTMTMTQTSKRTTSRTIRMMTRNGTRINASFGAGLPGFLTLPLSQGINGSPSLIFTSLRTVRRVDGRRCFVVIGVAKRA